MDEPTSSLDPEATATLEGLMRELAAEGVPVLLVSHGEDQIARVADPRADDARVAELVRRAALGESFAARDASALSGGEAQSVCLARALATDPHALLMDEPTSSLDPEATATLEELMRELAADGVPVLLVSHGEDQIARVADRVVRMDTGRITAVEERDARG
jgi:ABC-type phosphate transport system ATPase subunit